MSIKLDFEQRQRSNELLQAIIDDPEAFADEIIYLRDAAPSPSLGEPSEKDKYVPAEQSALAFLEAQLPNMRHEESVAECLRCNLNYVIQRFRERLASPPAAQEQKPEWEEPKGPGTPITFTREVVNLLAEIVDRVETPDDPERGMLFARADWLTRHFRKHPELCLPSPFASPTPALGWVMVPREPTDKMADAFIGAWLRSDLPTGDTGKAIWKAMLAAAKEPK